jgi:hypothetical protein
MLLRAFLAPQPAPGVLALDDGRITLHRAHEMRDLPVDDPAWRAGRRELARITSPLFCAAAAGPVLWLSASAAADSPFLAQVLAEVEAAVITGRAFAAVVAPAAAGLADWWPSRRAGGWWEPLSRQHTPAVCPFAIMRSPALRILEAAAALAARSPEARTPAAANRRMAGDSLLLQEALEGADAVHAALADIGADRGADTGFGAGAQSLYGRMAWDARTHRLHFPQLLLRPHAGNMPSALQATMGTVALRVLAAALGPDTVVDLPPTCGLYAHHAHAAAEFFPLPSADDELTAGLGADAVVWRRMRPGTVLPGEDARTDADPTPYTAPPAVLPVERHPRLHARIAALLGVDAGTLDAYATLIAQLAALCDRWRVAGPSEAETHVPLSVEEEVTARRITFLPSVAAALPQPVHSAVVVEQYTHALYDDGVQPVATDAVIASLTVLLATAACLQADAAAHLVLWTPLGGDLERACARVPALAAYGITVDAEWVARAHRILAAHLSPSTDARSYRRLVVSV